MALGGVTANSERAYLGRDLFLQNRLMQWVARFVPLVRPKPSALSAHHQQSDNHTKGGDDRCDDPE
jgi:hypothetical protein